MSKANALRAKAKSVGAEELAVVNQSLSDLEKELKSLVDWCLSLHIVAKLQKLLFVYIYSFMFIDLFSRRFNLKSVEFFKHFMQLKTLLALFILSLDTICTCIRKEFVELLIFLLFQYFAVVLGTFVYFL